MPQRLFGFGGGGGPIGAGPGYYPSPGLGGKKVLPTLGVSFGLPYPTHGYPISPYGNPHAPNPHFGAISPNGLNLGLLNVNPLFSLQVTKSEHGEKLVKPFVNLHVTPNEGIIGSIGKLFAHKKGSLHNHYHKHLHRYPPGPYGPHEYPPPHHFEGPHLPYPPPHHFEGPNYPPQFEGPHLPFPPQPHFEGPPQPHFEGPQFPLQPHFEGPPILSHPQPYFDGPIRSKPSLFQKLAGHHNSGFQDDIAFNPSVIGFRNNRNVTFNDQSEFPPNNQQNFNFPESNDNRIENESKDRYNYQSLYPQNFDNFNSIKDDTRYARQFSGFDENSANENILQSIPAQAPGRSEGSDMVSFPNSRRKRATDQKVPASIEKKESLESVNAESSENEGRALSAEKVKNCRWRRSLKSSS